MMKRKSLVTILIAVLAISTISAFSLSFAAAGTATISTDKPDYAPNEQVIITGGGFLHNQAIDISITTPDGSIDKVNGITSRADGTFIATYGQPPPLVYGLYIVVATDGTNTATTTFTDANFYFHETGLPTGITWGVTFRGGFRSATTPNDITYSGSNGNYAWTAATFSGGTGKQYVPSPNSGSLTNGQTASIDWVTQYQVNFATSGSGSINTPTTGSGYYNAGDLVIEASAGSGYYFVSWTSNTGSITFQTSNSASTTAIIGGTGTITANFAPTQATVLTVGCNPETVPTSGSMVTSVQGFLKAGDSGISSKTIELTYNDGVTWQPIGTATTQASGSYSYSWTVPSTLADDHYVVKAVFTGDGKPYLSSFDVTAEGPGNGGLLVVPEYIFGGLAALGACFVGLAVFKKRSSLPQLRYR